MEENRDAVKVELTKEDMNELESEFAKVEVYGARAPETLMEAHDTGVNFGNSSKGTQGKTPLPKN